MARTCPLSVVRLVLYGTGMSASLVHTEPLLLVEAGLRDLRSSSTEHEKILLSSDKYNCPLQSVMLGYCNASGELLTEDHWRVLVSSVSTADDALPAAVRPPTTIRWVGVVTAAEYSPAVGIGGRSSSHFISDELFVKQRRVLVTVSPHTPPIVVSWLLTTAMLKY